LCLSRLIPELDLDFLMQDWLSTMLPQTKENIY
jgi:hypothetical protein